MPLACGTIGGAFSIALRLRHFNLGFSREVLLPSTLPERLGASYTAEGFEGCTLHGMPLARALAVGEGALDILSETLDIK